MRNEHDLRVIVYEWRRLKGYDRRKAFRVRRKEKVNREWKSEGEWSRRREMKFGVKIGTGECDGGDSGSYYLNIRPHQ